MTAGEHAFGHALHKTVKNNAVVIIDIAYCGKINHNALFKCGILKNGERRFELIHLFLRRKRRGKCFELRKDTPERAV